MFGSIDRMIDPPFLQRSRKYPVYVIHCRRRKYIFAHIMQWHVIMLKFLYHNVSITVVIHIPVTSGMMECNVTAVMFCVTRHMYCCKTIHRFHNRFSQSWRRPLLATRAFSWLKAPTSAFTFKTLLRHYAKRALTPR